MLTFRYNPKRSKSNFQFRTRQTHRTNSDQEMGELPIAREVYSAVQQLDAVLIAIQTGLASIDPAAAAQSLSDALADLPPRVREALEEELGSLDRIARLIKLLGMVNCTADFDQHPAVINGCSELFAEVFGPDHGLGARSAVGVGSLPGNITVEIEAIFELK